MVEPSIVLLTGNRQIGKSTACLALAQMLRNANLSVSGLITQRTGPDDLVVHELHTGDTYPLTLPLDGDGGLRVGHFRFAPEALARSDRTLDACFPTQVFILDEIGQMELIHGQGWIRAISLLRLRQYHIAFIVVRPELLFQAIHQLPLTHYTVVHITKATRDSVPASLFAIAADACFSEGRPAVEEQ